MPSDVPSAPPQIPPFSALAALSNWPWERHYPPEFSMPPSSWTPSSSSRSLPRRSDSTSPPPRPLPDPSEHVAGDSSARSRVERSYSPSPSASSSSSKSHKHSQSHSRAGRTPLLTLPSASSPGAIVIPPSQTHSRSASTGFLKFPTARPHATIEKDARPLPQVPKVTKQTPVPPPLTMPSHEQTLQLPPPPRRAVTPIPESPATAPTVLTPPPRPKASSTASKPQVLYTTPEPTRAYNSTSPLAVLPQSAPITKAEKEQAREKTLKHNNADHRPVLIVFNPDQPFLNMHEPAVVSSSLVALAGDEAVSPPPPPPKPRRVPLPSTPRLTPRTNQPSASADAKRFEDSSAPAAPAARMPTSKKRLAKLSVAMRTSMGAAATPRSPKWPTDGLARKWYVERRGKRVTVKPQDAMVVAERLRMLR